MVSEYLTIFRAIVETRSQLVSIVFPLLITSISQQTVNLYLPRNAGCRLSETNKRPGSVILSLCSGAEAGQASIRTRTSGRVTATPLAWSQATSCKVSLTSTRLTTPPDALRTRPQFSCERVQGGQHCLTPFVQDPQLRRACPWRPTPPDIPGQDPQLWCACTRRPTPPDAPRSRPPTLVSIYKAANTA